jgi:hypothetical protein
MSTRTSEIGFSSQRLRYEWLRHIAWLASTGMEVQALQQELIRYIGETLSSAGAGGRGSREKIISILRQIWAPNPNQLNSMRRDGIRLLLELPDADHLAIHWGMTAAAYPFWAHTATCVGRLLRLQGTADSSQIQRRMSENYGDREIVRRATRNVLRSFIDWKVLQEIDKRGRYVGGAKLAVENFRLIAWLVEAWLRTGSSGSAPLKSLIDSPGLFPFRIESMDARKIIASSSRLEVLGHALDEQVVTLRTE